MADRYRVAVGNWNDTAGWSTFSGGDGGASVPTSNDDVYFDANTPANMTTINVQGYCNDFNCTGFNGIIRFSNAMHIYGNIILSPTLTFYGNTGENWNLYGSGKTITSNGCKIWLGLAFKSDCNITLSDNIDVSQNSNRTTVTTESNYTFNPNGKDFTISASKPAINGAFNFYNLLVQMPSGSSTDNYRFILSGNLTIVNNLTMISNAPLLPSRRLRVHTDYTAANPVTITCNGTVVATGCTFGRIIGAGTANWDFSANADFTGDCGGNTNIGTTPATTHYWVQATTSTDGMDKQTHWRTSSGGTIVSPRIVLPQDNLIFDENSFPVAGRVVNIGTTDCIGTTTWTNIQNSPTWNCNREFIVFGNLSLDTGMKFDLARTNIINMQGAANSTLNTKNITTNNTFNIRSTGATVTLQDDLRCNDFAINSGTFDTGGYNMVVSGTLYLAGSAGPLGFVNLRNSTITTRALNVMATSNMSITQGTSTIRIIGPLTSDMQVTAQGHTLYNLTLAFDGIYYWGFRATAANFCVGTFKMEPGSRYNNYNGNVLSCANIDINGTSEKPCYLGKIGSGNANLTKTGEGTVAVSNCIITRSAVTPTNTFFAKKSTDLGTNIGWTFVTGWQHKVNGITPEKVNTIGFADIGAVNGVEV
jgi:hypothetical protein